MIRISVLYPNGEGKIFDMKYYLAKHIPLVRRLSGAALKRVDVEEGVGGLVAGPPPPLFALGDLSFLSGPAFPSPLVPPAPGNTRHIPNHTQKQPPTPINTGTLFLISPP